MSNDAPKRRWFQFRLRTFLVVVAVVGCWLGYQVNWIRQRHSFLADQQAKFGQHFVAEDGGPHIETYHYCSAPGMLAIAGEQGYSTVDVFVRGRTGSDISSQDYQAIRRAEQLFPEAQICFTAVWEDGFWQGRWPRDLPAR